MIIHDDGGEDAAMMMAHQIAKPLPPNKPGSLLAEDKHSKDAMYLCNNVACHALWHADVNIQCIQITSGVLDN